MGSVSDVIFDYWIVFKLVLVVILSKVDDFIGIYLIDELWYLLKREVNCLVNCLGKVILEINCLEVNFFISCILIDLLFVMVFLRILLYCWKVKY